MKNKFFFNEANILGYSKKQKIVLTLKIKAKYITISYIARNNM